MAQATETIQITAENAPIRLEIGQPAPDFALPDQDGKIVRLEDLRGQRVVLFTYPEAFTPACTAEACEFGDSERALQAHGYRILAVSSDPVERLERFKREKALGYTLLSDEDDAVQTAYGAHGLRNKYGRIKVGPIRSTFVIDEHGNIEHALYNVRAAGHVARVRKLLGVE